MAKERNGILLNIVSLTLVLDTAYKSLKGLAGDLRERVLYGCVGFDRQNTENAIRNFENTGPLKGFFDITRGTGWDHICHHHCPVQNVHLIVRIYDLN